ncbi:peptidoglycan bridge formation glycyltransferase FemA/FemB family protein [Patescibacteria group bacterium]|nr:peptidoglycan bridge formation glycyltransferase FemA/FemB family protein [Patescibacteria group bacterium]MBU1931108.1 peptidoglycan bridge formation glycyltransferase FemA/FemB family protein [Patescibacteria group bacterium]
MENLNKYPDIRQSPAHARFMKSIGWQVATINNIQAFIKRLPCLPFSLMKIQRFNQPLDKQALDKIIKKHRVVFLKIEPQIQQPTKLSGFKKDHWPLSPSHTLWLDLKPSEKQLLAQMKAKTRYNIHLAQKKGLNIKVLRGQQASLTDLKAFYQIWRQRARKIHLNPPRFDQLKSLKTAFGQDFFLLLANQNEQLVTGLIILKYQQAAWYWHNASTKCGMKLFAPTLLTWQAIQQAKNSGCRLFDFEGIYDPRFSQQTKKWQGFTRFKTGFGGQKIQFPGPFVRWLNPFK